MKFWRAGEAEPDVPQLTYLDPDPIEFGASFLIGGRRDPDFTGHAKIDLTFDDVHFRTVEGWLDGDYSINQQLDVADINGLSRVVRARTNDAYYDLNDDDLVNDDDRNVWIQDLKGTYLGDANLDGEFNSGDLVAVFAAGEYEDAISLNSGWDDGDWDGDGDFGSGDLVAAFAGGGFELGPMPAAVVPEPSSTGPMMIGVIVIVAVSRTRPKNDTAVARQNLLDLTARDLSDAKVLAVKLPLMRLGKLAVPVEPADEQNTWMCTNLNNLGRVQICSI